MGLVEKNGQFKLLLDVNGKQKKMKETLHVKYKYSYNHDFFSSSIRAQLMSFEYTVDLDVFQCFVKYE